MTLNLLLTLNQNDGMFVEPQWFLLTTDSTHQLHLTTYVASGDR